MKIKGKRLLFGIVFIIAVGLLFHFVSKSGRLRRVKSNKSELVYGGKNDEMIFQGRSLKKSGEFFYILDTEGWCIKLLDGNFKTLRTVKIQKGQGPEELQFLTGMDISKGRLYVGGGNEILVYGPKLDYISKIRLPIVMVFDFAVVGHNLFTSNFISPRKLDKSHPPRPFVEVDLNTMRKKEFGELNLDLFGKPIDASFWHFEIHGSELFVNAFLAPVVKIYDPETLAIKEEILLPGHEQYNSFSPLCFDPYGHGFIAMISEAKKRIDLLCMNSNLKPMFIQQMADDVTLVDFVIDRKEEFYFLSKGGTLILHNRISPDIFSFDKSVPLEDYINSYLKQGYHAKQVANHYIQKAKEMGIKSDPIIIGNTIGVFYFQKDKIFFYGGRFRTSIFCCQGNKYSLITKSQIGSSYRAPCRYQYTGNSFFLFRSGSGRGIFQLSLDGNVLSKDHVNFMPIYSNADGSEVFGCDDHENIIRYDRKKTETILKSTEFIQRNLKSKYLEPIIYNTADGMTWIFCKNRRYYFCIDQKKEIRWEGALLPKGLPGDASVYDVVVVRGGNELLVAAGIPYGNGENERLVVYKKQVSLKNYDKLFDIPFPFSFKCKLNQEGDILIQFPNDRDYLILIEKGKLK